MKTRLKIGDLVRLRKYPGLGVGEVIRVATEGMSVKWLDDGLVFLYDFDDLELSETPIQRMKRLYGEKD